MEKVFCKLFNFKWIPTSELKAEEAEKKVLDKSGVEYEKFYVEIDKDVKLNTIKFGNGKKNLILIHGYGAGSGVWVANMKSLSEVYTVYSIDLAGFARSSRNFEHLLDESKDIVTRYEDFYVNAFERWREKTLPKETFLLAAHSFGGYLSAIYAFQYPQYIDHLILIDIWGIPAQQPLTEEQKEFRKTWKWKVANTLYNVGSPFSIVRLAGSYGEGLVAKGARYITTKFDFMFDQPNDTSLSSYIYHMNAMYPSGEIAFRSTNNFKFFFFWLLILFFTF
eukprot:TRINITY_DN6065_c0_g1_i2.p1 TRINITY_DN6065_c0_g1~~TRINITY_DN6065_c0_g1_i2.p1  ORF type:complete len:290 (-),score=46.36 TRINITY_DN6065_c0_g1_i2:22-858(-)